MILLIAQWYQFLIIITQTWKIDFQIFFFGNCLSEKYVRDLFWKDMRSIENDMYYSFIYLTYLFK